MNKPIFAAGIIIFISFLSGLLLYNTLPEKMISHWNIQNIPDDYMPKQWILLGIPILTAFLVLLMTVLPKIDPLKKNIARFKEHYSLFILIMTLFMTYLYFLTLAANLNITFDMARMLAPAFAILFFYSGILIERTKRNWFIGIRTPWTLSSDKIWHKTHKVGGKLFKTAGIIALFGAIFPKYAFWLIIIPVLTFALYTVVYSYWLYKQETLGKQKFPARSKAKLPESRKLKSFLGRQKHGGF